MEPVFDGDEWPTMAAKKKALGKARQHYLLKLLTPAERARVRRFVFVDIGARSFSSSTTDFLESYPDARRFDVHAFEMDAKWAKKWREKAAAATKKGSAKSFRMTQAGVTDRDGTATVSTGSEAAMKNIGGRAYTGAGNAGGTEQVPMVDFARWLRETVSEDDFVVVKLDVEGSEYTVLPHLLQTGAISLIDEMMLEAHYDRHSWKVIPQRGAFCTDAQARAVEAEGKACVHRREAVRWIALLRELCVHAHEWR